MKQLAEKYNTTIETIKKEQYNFLQAEGYLDNGTECETFGEWLDAKFANVKIEAEPFQKGDLEVGNLS